MGAVSDPAIELGIVLTRTVAAEFQELPLVHAETDMATKLELLLVRGPPPQTHDRMAKRELRSVIKPARPNCCKFLAVCTH